MQAVIDVMPQENDPVDRLLREAYAIHEEDINANKTMGELGACFIREKQRPGSAVMTHCNTGALATGGYGTALRVVRTAYQEGLVEQVYALLPFSA